MKKFVHPDLINTLIQAKDGSIYFKRWNFFRTKLLLETDLSTHPLWSVKNKTLNKKSKKKV